MTQDDLTTWHQFMETVIPLSKPAPVAKPKVVAPPKPIKKPPPREIVGPASIDLHGLTLVAAHRRVIEFIENTRGRSSVTVITGKSGQIRREFESWVSGIAKIHSVTPKSNGGAFLIRILKTHR